MRADRPPELTCHGRWQVTTECLQCVGAVAAFVINCQGWDRVYGVCCLARNNLMRCLPLVDLVDQAKQIKTNQPFHASNNATSSQTIFFFCRSSQTMITHPLLAFDNSLHFPLEGLAFFVGQAKINYHSPRFSTNPLLVNGLVVSPSTQAWQPLPVSTIKFAVALIRPTTSHD